MFSKHLKSPVAVTTLLVTYGLEGHRPTLIAIVLLMISCSDVLLTISYGKCFINDHYERETRRLHYVLHWAIPLFVTLIYAYFI